MTTETQKHTLGPIHLHGKVHIEPDGSPHMRLMSSKGLYMGKLRFCTDEEKANAARFVLAWNCHDELLNVCDLVLRFNPKLPRIVGMPWEAIEHHAKRAYAKAAP